MATHNKVWVLTIACVVGDETTPDELLAVAEKITDEVRATPGVESIRQSCLSTTEAFVLHGDPTGPLHVTEK